MQLFAQEFGWDNVVALYCVGIAVARLETIQYSEYCCCVVVTRNVVRLIALWAFRYRKYSVNLGVLCGKAPSLSREYLSTAVVGVLPVFPVKIPWVSLLFPKNCIAFGGGYRKEWTVGQTL